MKNAQLEAAQETLLEILKYLRQDGSYKDWDHLLASMQSSGLTPSEILKDRLRS